MNNSQKYNTQIVIDELKLFSIIPILRLFLKYGRVKIYFGESSTTGLVLIRVLVYLGLVYEKFEKILNPYLMGQREGMHHHGYFFANLEMKSIRSYTEDLLSLKYFSLEEKTRKLIALSVANFSGEKFGRVGINLLVYANYIHKQNGLSGGRTVFCSSYAKLFKHMNIYEYCPDCELINIISQPIAVHSIFYQLNKYLLCMLFLVKEYVASFNFRYTDRNKISKNALCFPAVWGVNSLRKNDFFWNQSKLIRTFPKVYFFDRPDLKLDDNILQEIVESGVKPAIYSTRAVGTKDAKKFMVSGLNIKQLFSAISLVFLGVLKSWSFDWYKRYILTEALYVYLRALEISEQLIKSNASAVLHYSEASHDRFSLACEIASATRFGVHWSIFNGPNECDRGHQVFFFWGQSEVDIAIDSGILSKYLVVTGSLIKDFSNSADKEYVKSQVLKLKENGSKKIIVLFDGSSPVANFYFPFLEWLIDDESVGILIKTKGAGWRGAIVDNGLDNIVKRADATNRLIVLDSKINPADASCGVDFSICMGSPSAAIVSALSGSRAIYLDYERIDQGPLKKYSKIHQLGKDHCVFHDPEQLIESIVRFYKFPDEMNYLGDMSSVIKYYDPFNDGKAGERIGDFIGWYLEYTNLGHNQKESLEYAVNKYQSDWGEQYVIAGKVPV